MTVLPQQHKADLLLQVWGNETVCDLPFHNVIWNREITATFMAVCSWRSRENEGEGGSLMGSDPSDLPMRPPEVKILRGSHIILGTNRSDYLPQAGLTHDLRQGVALQVE